MAPATSTDLTDVVQRVQSLLLVSGGIRPFLQHLAGLATTAADQSLACGITARRDGHPLTVASSDDRATALDETQYDLGDGPCLHALATGHQVLMATATTTPPGPELPIRRSPTSSSRPRCRGPSSTRP